MECDANVDKETGLRSAIFLTFISTIKTVMSAITKIEVETWTADVANASTDDRIDCIITFMDNRSFQQQLNNVVGNFNDFEQGDRNRFNLNLSEATAAAAVSGQQHTDVKSITIKKIVGGNAWKCEAVCIRVNDTALLSRKFSSIKTLDATGSSFVVTLRKSGVLDGLEVRITTGTFGSELAPSTDDLVSFTLKFTSGSFQIIDLPLRSVQNDFWDGDDFQKGRTYSYLIPIWEDANFLNTPADIDEIKLSKPGSDGWFLKGAQLYANGNPIQFFGNQNINQFLDNDPEVLSIVDWSSKGTRSLGGSSWTIVSPVLGYISDTSASVQYRIEREGTYRLKVFNHSSGALVQTIDKQLLPTGVFVISALAANTQYNISFFFVLNGTETPLHTGDTSFRTSPPEGQGVRFSFGFGSCCRNKNNPVQTVWNQVKNISLDPATDIVATQPENDLRFFIHCGDTFYFYDDVANVGVRSLPTNEVLSVTRAAHLSARLNSNFLDMAKRVPTCAVWDDHDFSYNDHDSTNFANKSLARQAFLEYWATPFSSSYGLTCRMSYGNVDIYLMDGRYNRLESQGKMFTSAQCNFIIQDIEARGTDKLRILVTGSTWKHKDSPSPSHYGYSDYDTERKAFYTQLSNLISQGKTKGLVLLSGDIHRNEIYEVALGNGKVSPELVCSPIGENVNTGPGGNGARSYPDGERKWSISAIEKNPTSDSNWGFATIRIDTRGSGPWTILVNYRNFATGATFLNPPKSYVLSENQFKW